MSALQRQLLTPKAAALLKRLPERTEASPETAEDNSFLPPTSQPARRARKDYSPTTWDQCFDSCSDVKIPGTEDTFRVYQIKPTEQPAISTVHTPLFILHHGAGHSGLSFGLTARQIKWITFGKAAVLTYDCRGHGYTRTADDTDLSLPRLSQDLVDVVRTVYGDELLDIVLVGHSMGGSVVTDVAHRQLLSPFHVLGLAVLDVVEGSAMEALSSMLSYLRTRPTEFKSLEQAIEWSIRSATIHNLESAKLSIPPLLVPVTASVSGSLGLREEEEEEGEGEKETEKENGESHHEPVKRQAVSGYTWRTNLAKTERYWTEWFTGMSDKFLTARTAKLLILAGTDRLDKPLTIGQMQGKFQMQIFPECGHAVQEDAPDRMAVALVEFWKRNERLNLPTRKVVPMKPATVVAGVEMEKREEKR